MDPSRGIGGLGAGKHSIHNLPALFTNDSDTSSWVVTIPVGLGFQVPLNERTRLSFTQGYTYRDDLNGAILRKGNDTFFGWTIGLTFGHFALTGQKVEKRPDKPAPVPVSVQDSSDDDGDGVKDGDEIFKGTDPMKPE